MRASRDFQEWTSSIRCTEMLDRVTGPAALAGTEPEMPWLSYIVLWKALLGDGGGSGPQVLRLPAWTFLAGVRHLCGLRLVEVIAHMCVYCEFFFSRGFIRNIQLNLSVSCHSHIKDPQIFMFLTNKRFTSWLLVQCNLESTANHLVSITSSTNHILSCRPLRCGAESCMTHCCSRPWMQSTH